MDQLFMSNKEESNYRLSVKGEIIQQIFAILITYVC